LLLCNNMGGGGHISHKNSGVGDFGHCKKTELDFCYKKILFLEWMVTNSTLGMEGYGDITCFMRNIIYFKIK
jgi:hypothetical protein